MISVTVWGALSAVTDGKTELEFEAKDIRELFAQLEQQYPGVKPYLKRGIAVSVDGVIYRDAWSTKLREDSEIFLLPRLAGG